MSRTLLIAAGTPMEAAVAEDGRLAEYLIDSGDGGAADTVLLGRVERIVKGMDAAFVDIGAERSAFLPLKEKSGSFDAVPLQCGMAVPVQIRREAHDRKGAFLSRDITLCGEYVLLMPLNRYTGISAKITDGEAREALKRLGRELSGDRFGLVLRTAAAEADAELIAAEAEELYARWEEIRRAAATAHVPSVLYRGGGLTEGLLRDYAPRGIDAVVTNDSGAAAAFRDICPVTLTEDDPIAARGLYRERDRALERFVWLKSGGSLFIDECEALTVIDVNSGKYTGKRCQGDTALRIDLEACGEIARQLRLRALGGIIIIDFIDLRGEDERRQVTDRLAECLREDRCKTVIHGFTALGLLEMTRKRTRVTLREAMRRLNEQGERNE